MSKKNGNKPRILNRQEIPLAVELTAEEKLDRGKQLASVLGDIQREESRADMVKTSLKSAMAAFEARRDELASVVARGAEIRNVSCEDHTDDARGRILRVRMDTGEVIHERPMTPEERQEKLELVGAKD